MSFTYVETRDNAKIKVIGVGGAGGNAVNNMIESNLKGVEFIVANTDIQALNTSRADHRIQLGVELTKGLGAGANPQNGRDAALENNEEIREALADCDMVFITAGLGGGTGTGAAPVVAEICKDLGILTVAVVSKPFAFEGKAKTRKAEAGLEELRQFTDTLITIPNDRLRGLAAKEERMVDMFLKADEILNHSVKGISDLIMIPGLVNLDFADVKTTMSQSGIALMGIGIASGEGRALQAAEKAISHPLLEDISIAGSRNVLMNITSSSDITMDEMMEASDRIHNEVGDDAEIIWGQTIDETLGDEMRITVIATGIGQEDVQPVSRISPLRRATEQTFDATGTTGSRFGSGTTIVRGTVRTLTEEDESKEWQDDVGPVKVIPKTAPSDAASASTEPSAYSNAIKDQKNLDVPTYLRRSRD